MMTITRMVGLAALTALAMTVCDAPTEAAPEHSAAHVPAGSSSESTELGDSVSNRGTDLPR